MGLNLGLDVNVVVNVDNRNEIGIEVGVCIEHAYENENVNLTPGIENGNGNWAEQALHWDQQQHQELYNIYYSRHNRSHQYEALDFAMSALPHMVCTQLGMKGDTSTQINVGMRMEQEC